MGQETGLLTGMDKTAMIAPSGAKNSTEHRCRAFVARKRVKLPSAIPETAGVPEQLLRVCDVRAIAGSDAELFKWVSYRLISTDCK
jgi:hypothetical protein